MKTSEFNTKLRDMVISFISDGFIRSDISAATFGVNRQDQMKKFVEGRDLGLKPLDSIFEMLGFEFHLVPILKSNSVDREIVNTIAEESLDTFRWVLIDHLQGINTKKRFKKSGLATVVDREIEILKGDN